MSQERILQKILTAIEAQVIQMSGNIGAISFIGNLTQTAADLLITAVAGKDIIFKLGDHAGAKKIKVTDDADALVASIDSDGTITGVKLIGNLPIATAAAAPESAGMINAFGAIATKAGFVGVYIDSTAETGATYLITCDGVAYYATDLSADVLS